MDVEEWRALPGFEGLYEVSSFGQVRRIPGGRGTRGGILKQAREGGPHGRMYVNLCRDRKAKTYRVHRLVALAFHGPLPAGLETRHLDGDHLNNRADNLRYGTKSENAWDQVRHGTHPMASLTQCKHGHAFDEANTYYTAKGYRGCVTCRRIRTREYDARKRAELRAA